MPSKGLELTRTRLCNHRTLYDLQLRLPSLFLNTLFIISFFTFLRKYPFFFLRTRRRRMFAESKKTIKLYYSFFKKCPRPFWKKAESLFSEGITPTTTSTYLLKDVHVLRAGTITLKYSQEIGDTLSHSIITASNYN